MSQNVLQEWFESQRPYREGSPASATSEHARSQAVAEEHRRDAADDALYEALKDTPVVYEAKDVAVTYGQPLTPFISWR